MNLQKHKVLLLVIVSVSALLFASPALQRFLTLPQTEFFTEFWLLGPGHKAENYPFNITLNHDYPVFLDVKNQLGNRAHYSIHVKFRNQTQPNADSFNGTSCSLPSLYETDFFVGDKETWELPLTLAFDYSYNGDFSKVTFHSIMFSNIKVLVNEQSASWDPQRSGFFGNLLFELWIYNDTANSFQYHDRFTGLWLNMTV